MIDGPLFDHRWNNQLARDAEGAALEAARLRFRPILMTAISSLLGTLPLLIAAGAGAGSRKALGTAVFGGMLIGTILGILLTPSLYRMIQGLTEKLSRKKPEAA